MAGVSGFCFVFFNDTATTEIYTLSLHDALPISPTPRARSGSLPSTCSHRAANGPDRKSTRLNSSHLGISYAVFCLKKNEEPNERASRVSEYLNAYSEHRDSART